MKKTLAELKAENVPHASCEMVGINIKGPSSEGETTRRALDAYLANFCAPETKDQVIENPLVCVCCGHSLTGIFGTFTWGICHGEGYCGHCNYPARGFHDVKDEAGEGVARLSNVVLQYHPDVLEENPEVERVTA